MESVGIVGIGAMGSGIATNLLKAGYSLTAFKRDTLSGNESARQLEAKGASICTNLSELFSLVDVLITCVPSSKDVEAILLGSKGLEGKVGNETKVKAVLDFSTSHPDSTRKIGKALKEKHIEFLDTPMTGSVREAQEGTLRIIVGGCEKAFEKYVPLLRSVSELVLYAGPSGTGNMVKLANNYLSLLDQAATAAVSLVLDSYEIPRPVYTEFLGKSSANSGGFKLMMYRINSNDFIKKFELGLALKDIKYCRDIFPSGILENLYTILKGASEAGYHEKDVGTIYHYLKGVETPQSN